MATVLFCLKQTQDMSRFLKIITALQIPEYPLRFFKRIQQALYQIDYHKENRSSPGSSPQLMAVFSSNLFGLFYTWFGLALCDTILILICFYFEELMQSKVIYELSLHMYPWTRRGWINQPKQREGGSMNYPFSYTYASFVFDSVSAPESLNIVGLLVIISFIIHLILT